MSNVEIAMKQTQVNPNIGETRCVPLRWVGFSEPLQRNGFFLYRRQKK